MNCKKNPNKLGRWTAKGYLRYNELLELTRAQRQARSNSPFEDNLMKKYKLDMEKEAMTKGMNCKIAPFHGKIVKDEKMATVTVTNVLTFTMI